MGQVQRGCIMCQSQSKLRYYCCVPEEAVCFNCKASSICQRCNKPKNSPLKNSINRLQEVSIKCWFCKNTTNQGEVVFACGHRPCQQCIIHSISSSIIASPLGQVTLGCHCTLQRSVNLMPLLENRCLCCLKPIEEAPFLMLKNKFKILEKCRKKLYSSFISEDNDSDSSVNLKEVIQKLGQQCFRCEDLMSYDPQKQGVKALCPKCARKTSEIVESKQKIPPLTNLERKFSQSGKNQIKNPLTSKPQFTKCQSCQQRYPVRDLKWIDQSFLLCALCQRAQVKEEERLQVTRKKDSKEDSVERTVMYSVCIMCDKRFKLDALNESKKNNGNFCRECYEASKLSAFFEDEEEVPQKQQKMHSEERRMPQIDLFDKMRRDNGFAKSKEGTDLRAESNQGKIKKCVDCNESFVPSSDQQQLDFCSKCIGLQHSIEKISFGQFKQQKISIQDRRAQQIASPPPRVLQPRAYFNKYEQYLLDLRVDMEPVMIRSPPMSGRAQDVMRTQFHKIPQRGVLSTIFEAVPQEQDITSPPRSHQRYQCYRCGIFCRVHAAGAEQQLCQKCFMEVTVKKRVGFM